MTVLAWATLVVVAATIVGIAVGRWPLLRADRTTIALIGAAALLAIGALSLDQAADLLDFDTLLLLFSMMIVNAHLSLAGFFDVVTERVLRVARSPRMFLALVIVAAGVLSAFFLNDTVVLLMTPLVIDSTRTLRRDPVPYLLGLATAANVGSVATLTGNPQNIIIGNASRIPYVDFAAALTPTALIGLAICWMVIALVYRSEFRAAELSMPAREQTTVFRPLFRKTIVVIALMIVLFFVGVPVPLAAFLAAAVLLATRRIKPQRVFAKVDWSLLVFFAALFVVTGSLELQGVSDKLFALLAPLTQAGLVPFGIATAVLSNLVSNVPAVLLLQHTIAPFADQQRAWLMLAAASTLAGNFTLLGSVANLIVAEIAGRAHVRISFGAYARVGIPITVLTLAVAFVLI